MITKKVLAISCLFLALPVCAMKRGSRVGRRALVHQSLKSFDKKHLSTVLLSGKQKGRRGKRYASREHSSGVPINFVAKRLFSTNEKEKELMEQIELYDTSAFIWGCTAYVLGFPSIIIGGFAGCMGVLGTVCVSGGFVFGTLDVQAAALLVSDMYEHFPQFASRTAKFALLSTPAAAALARFLQQRKKRIAAESELIEYHEKITTQKVDDTK